MGKKLTTPTKDASWARLPRIEAISVLQAQLFDNRDKAEGVKGRSDYALKLFAWTSGYNIELTKPEWWRVVQLVEPKTVLTWATKKLSACEMTAQQFEMYNTVADQAATNQQSGDYALVKMGHISSPPGTQYFVGQFVYLHQNVAGEVAGILFNDEAHLVLDDFKITRKRGRVRKPGTPTHAMLHDLGDILGKQRREAEALEARRALRSTVRVQDDGIDPAFRAYLGSSPF